MSPATRSSTEVTGFDSIGWFEGLAHWMQTHPERFEHLGDIEMSLALVILGPERDFRVRLDFEGIECPGVTEIDQGGERGADCWLVGDAADWAGMWADILAHGHATGEWTLNTLAVFGNRISLHSTDPMGEDRFHRFNQTLQEFFDGAAAVAADRTEDER